MNIHFDNITTGNQYGKIASKFASAEKTTGSSKGAEQVQMKDTASTSSWARITSGALQRIKEGCGEPLRQEKVDHFKNLLGEGGDLPLMRNPDEIADSIFSRMFG
jgi:hypothetical protein